MLIQPPKIIKLKDLRQTIDYYGKTWIVCTLAKEDIISRLNKKQFAKITDEDMANLAEKLEEALYETAYWECLNTILADYKK